MEKIAVVLFVAFWVFLIALDISMIVSLLRSGDERRQLIVWKASTSTLLVVVAGFAIDIVESLVRSEAMLSNPFIKLSVTAIVYLLTLLYYKKKYGD